MKKFFRMVMALSLVGGVLAFSGCTDYEDDINALDDRVTALEGTVADLQSQIESGAVITSVTQTDNGITVTLSNGESYEITNGQDGTDGTPGSVVEIGENGNWFIDNVDTGMPSQGAAGADGQPGADGADADVVYYRPNMETGNWDKVTISAETGEETVEPTEESWRAAGVTAVWDSVSGTLTFTGVDGSEEPVVIKLTLSKRLTSVSLIPTAYLDGVPVIKFNSYEYYPKTVNAENETVTAADDAVLTTGAATEVSYHISPSNISKTDIENPEYLIQTAEMITTRAVDGIELNVVDYDIKEDVLTATVRRAAGISLNYEGEGDYIYTAALKVPIAEGNLVENETEANVYSEYSALYEETVTPYIAALIDDSKGQTGYDCPDGVNHFYATYAEAATATSGVAETGAYNASIDLLAMVTGCDEAADAPATGHSQITKETLKANGLAFRFAVPTSPFALGDNETDQQQFAVVEQNVDEGTAVLKSTYPGAAEGAAANQAAVDKTPVVRVELVDTVNNNIVDVRYFKVQWTKVPVVAEPEDLGLVYTFDYVLGCDDFDGSFNWAQFVQYILSEVNDGSGLSYNDFVNTYSSADATYEVEYAVDATRDTDDPVFAISWDGSNSTYDEYAAAFNWNIKPVEFGSLIDGSNVADLNEGDVIDTFTIKVTLPSADNYNGDITFSFAVNVKVPELPALVGLVTSDWIVDGELARIRPVQYRSQNAQDHVTYNYDLTTLFRTNSEGSIMDNVLPVAGETDLACRAWSLQFAADQMNGYVPGFNSGRSAFRYADEDAEEQGAGYDLYNTYPAAGGVLATYMTYGEDADNPTENWHQDVHGDIALSLTGTEWTEVGTGHYKGTDEAIALLESIDTPVSDFENRVTVNAWGRINPYNHVIVKSFDVVFIKPLYVTQSSSNQFFEDGYEGGRYVNVEDLFTAEDSWDYPVNIYTDPDASTDDEVLANGRKVYYDVQNPSFNLEDARISMVLSGSDYVPMDDASALTDEQIEDLPFLSAFDQSASVVEDDRDSDGVDELVFTSERGWNLEKVVYIYVKVSIEHKWGTESIWVHIPVYPHGQAPAGN